MCHQGWFVCWDSEADGPTLQRTSCHVTGGAATGGIVPLARLVSFVMSDVQAQIFGSSGGVVVKLLACGAGGPGFDSRSRRNDFRDWLSPASNSRYG